MQVLMSSTVGTLRAAQQWNILRNVLLSVGVDVIVMTKIPPGSPFTAEAGLIDNNLFIPSRFYDEGREAEEAYFMRWFADHKFDVVEGNILGERKLASFESTDAVLDKTLNILWYGVGFKSSLLFSDSILQNRLENYDPAILTLKSPDLPHLNSCFCPLESGGCLWYPEAFSNNSQFEIDLWYNESAIAVSDLDARSFACNSISIGKILITPLISEELIELLNKRGITVIPLDMSEFIRIGGACRSLILEV